MAHFLKDTVDETFDDQLNEAKWSDNSDQLLDVLIHDENKAKSKTVRIVRFVPPISDYRRVDVDKKRKKKKE
jgi:hypothetical protein